MTSAVLDKKDALELFNHFDSDSLWEKGRPVISNYNYGTDLVSFFGVIKHDFTFNRVITNQLIDQARKLRNNHLWFLWGLRSPSRRVIDSAISVIKFCPSEFLLHGYNIENYGNGTVVLIKRSANFMTTINIGKDSLTYAKLNIPKHVVVDSGKLNINKEAVSKLFERL